ncbi:hypothetical protein SUGI_0612090 [Cryptomeria japonica]|uniref:uncharacterized protein LOC131037385 n=1 Tax=Cryptomeria japonica TaxID=3369 RepID=UPI0024147D7E|nr:uncharacterized protein LOC131037385 [Cryptomeria japonica]GLJ30824.1 hypothetical protein SUGI_0612090 [Cryptomeria japonica]
MEGENTSTANSSSSSSSSVGSKLKKGMLDATTNITEALQYIKAFFLAQGKKLVAKNEQELAEADLQAQRIEVDATDAAETEKKQHDLQSY